MGPCTLSAHVPQQALDLHHVMVPQLPLPRDPLCRCKHQVWEERQEAWGPPTPTRAVERMPPRQS